MADATAIVNDQMKQLTDMQSKAFEPMRLFSNLAMQTMDTVVRKHYAVMGDVVEYTLKQAQLPLSGGDVNQIASAQMAEANKFGELLNTRAGEYAEIASTFGERARAVSEDATAALKVA